MSSNVGQGIAVAKNVKVTHNQFVEQARAVVSEGSDNTVFELLSQAPRRHPDRGGRARGNWSARNGFVSQ